MKAKVEKIYPLSPMQKGMLFHALENPSEDAYFEQTVLDICGEIHPEILEQSFNQLLERHEILRASIHTKLEEPVHVVLARRAIGFTFHDLRGRSDDEVAALMQDFMEKDRAKGFNLSKDNLLRIALVCTGEQHFQMIWTFHHMILDGWSMGILFNELLDIYTDKSNGLQSEMGVTRPYSNYMKWLQQQDQESGLGYWEHYLSGYSEKTGLPSINRPTSDMAFSRREKKIVFSQALTTKMKEMAQKHAVTIHTVIQAMWGFLLAKYNDNEDAVFGTVVSGRDAAVDGIENMVGLFINTIPTRVTFSGEQPFVELMKKIQSDALSSQAYQYLSLAEVQARTELKHDLLDHVVVFENYALDTRKMAERSDLGFEINEITGEERTNYPFTMAAGLGEKLTLLLIYDEHVYEPALMDQIETHMKAIIDQITSDESIHIQDITLVLNDELPVLEQHSMGAVTDYPKWKTIPQLFDEQVQKKPHAIALIMDDVHITYRELQEKADQMASLLYQFGLPEQAVVGLLADRSVDMIAGILGILKAGAAYLPMDPSWPKERISHMLQDSRAAVLLTQSQWISQAPPDFPLLLLNADSMDHMPAVMEMAAATQVMEVKHDKESRMDDLAYMIYTSGSTGLPKGVMITHANVIRVVCETDYIDICSEDRILQLSNYAFDGSVFDIFGALLNGACLVLLKQDTVLDTQALAEVIVREKVTVSFMTTALFNLLIDREPECLRGFRKVLFGGERASVTQARKGLDILGPDRLIHVYGPTESTVFATAYPISSIDAVVTNLPIGKPIANTSVWVLDRYQNPVPAGIPGELCISGDGLSLGYLNNKELTDSRFIPHPLLKGTRMYRTGDRVRRVQNGDIEFLERLDHQVKLRGYRIELGEIEHVLLEHEGIREGIVVTRKDAANQDILIAYLKADPKLTSAGIRTYVSERLPDYMVPSYFILLDELPLTGNGKVDRRALPEPAECIEHLKHDQYEAPSTVLENHICTIWKEILGVQTAGVQDHFFESGGHSLKATALASRIHKEIQVMVPIRQLFLAPTIRGIANYIESAAKEDYLSIQPAESKPYYALSSAQRRLHMLHQISDTGTSYNMPAVMKVSGKLDVLRFEEAFRQLVQRHESFRTSFVIVDGEPVQRIHSHVPFAVEHIEPGSRSLEETLSDRIRPFELDKAPLMRIELVKISEQEHVVVMDMHHIIADGVSTGVLVQEFHELYEGKSLPELKLQYKDYSEWQKDWFNSEGLKTQETYWLNRFEGEIPVLQLPTDWPRPQVYSFKGNRVQFVCDEQLTRELHQLARDHEATLYMVLLAAYTTLLSRYSGQDDIVVGSPIAGRKHADLQRVIGMFVNTLAMRNYPVAERSFNDFLGEVKENALQAYENQDYPLDELINKLHVSRDRSRNALVDTMFVLQNLELERTSGQQWDDLHVEPYETELPIAKFDLTLAAVEQNGRIEFELEYCSDLFSLQTVENMGNHFIQLLKGILSNPQGKLGEFEVVSEEEKQTLQHVYNDNARSYPLHQRVYEWIEQNALRTPDQVAVMHDGRSMTYHELNEAADLLAARLRQHGVTKETVVGIMMDRSVEMIAGILGIMKSGGAYLPLDPSTPVERIRYMLQDSGAGLVVTQNHWSDRLRAADSECVTFILDEAVLKDWNAEASLQVSFVADSATMNTNPDDLAYIIYTSGSTGLPKGVQVEQSALTNFCCGYIDALQITERDRVANYLQMTFDASISEIFPALMSGATLHIIPIELRLDILRLNEYLSEYGITVSTLSSKVCESFVELPNSSLRLLVSGGEQLKLHNLPNYRLINAYGPTENTVVTTLHEVDSIEGVIPIGKPFTNTRIFILNDHLQFCPIGVTGEMYIAGQSLARGYLNNPELTTEKFVDNPHEPGGKMYRTGDLVRWLPGGNLQFMGRTDQQVKIRGYRIELGEIEQQLLKHPAIRETAVLAHQDPQGNGALCAYVVAEGEAVWTAATVRDWLEAELPDYMIPAYVVQLDQLPLTSHGKLDRKALREPDHHLPAGPETEAPRSEVERILVEVWRDVLNMAELGINHQFFVSGGDSIKALQIGSRLARAGLRMEVRDLFAYPKIRDLSPYVKWDQRERRSQEPVEGEVRLTPIQQWFFANNTTERNHFTQSFMLHRVAGFKPDVLEQVLDRLLEHHDALRMRYEIQADGSIRQFNRPVQTGERMYTLHRFDTRGWDEPERQVYEAATQVQQACNLEEGKLVQVGWFEAEDGDHLLLAIHHLVVDGVSWRILLEDMEVLYQQAERGEALAAGEKTDSYQRFAEALQDYANSPQAAKERAYWSRLAAEETGLNLGEQEEAAGPDRFADSHTQQSTLSAEVTQQLLRESNRAYQTEINDLLLSALYLAVRKLTGELKLKVNLEGHGREDVLEGIDLSRTVGWFTTLYPVLLEGEAEDELATTIKRVKEGLRKVPHKGFSYGALKYVARMPELQEERPASISFNYLGEMDGGMIGEAMFRESRFSTGQTIGGHIARNNPIELNTFVSGGKLHLNVTANQTAVDMPLVSQFAETFLEQLTEIVDHCLCQRETTYTPSDYGDPSLALEELDLIKSACPGVTIERIYPLTNMQQGMLFHAMEDETSTAYFQQTVMEIRGEVNPDYLQSSFNELMNRHEALRASFMHQDLEEPRQVIMQNLTIEFEFKDWTALEAHHSAAQLETFSQQDKARSFRLDTQPLMRAALFRTTDQSYTLVWSHHHILLDGWCLGIILSELFQIYKAKLENKAHNLKEPKRYHHYIEWLIRQEKDEAQAYWRRYLENYDTQSSVPGLLLTEHDVPYLRKEQTISLGQELTRQLNEIGARYGVTLNTVIQCIWGLVLARYNDTEDVIFGTVVSGREAPVEGIEEMIGLFINTIPVRIGYPHQKHFGDVLQVVQKQAVESQRFNYLNLAEVQALSDLNKELMDHVFVFENYALDHGAVQQSSTGVGFEITGLHAEEQSNYGFLISATPGDSLTLVITYDGNKYDPSIIERMDQHFRSVAEQVTSADHQQLADIQLVGSQEREVLLNSFNNSDADYPRNMTIHELFQQQVRCTPDRIAVRDEHRHMTYMELNERSNQLARTLLSLTGGTEQFIGIMADRSVDMIVAIMAVLKAGAAYIPVDPTYPDDRISYMLEDSGIRLLVVSEKGMDRGLHRGLSVVLEEENSYHADARNLETSVQSHDLAYVIYTSGTTGNPKGTLIEHKNVVRLLINDRNRFDFSDNDIWTMFHSFCFDFSVWEMYGALLYGGTLLIVPHLVAQQPGEFLQWLIREKVTILNQTPSYFYRLMHEEAKRPRKELSLRKVIFGGEALSPSLLATWYKRYPSTKLINMYGITETTVHVTYKEITPSDIQMGRSNIGQPIPTLRAYILNQYRQLQPVGCAGELYVAGEGLARGYLNRSSLTEERFVEDPFYPGEKMYRSGDLARWRADGNMEYLGRMDHQVKIRGYRIELGEIEHQLLQLYIVKDAFVVARADEEHTQFICAYITLNEEADDAVTQQIRQQLSLQLPDYMMPAYIVKMDQLPLTSNGKVDRKALPAPEAGMSALGGYEAPGSRVEAELLALWHQLLNNDRIGVNHNFFEVGGHSLKASALVSRVHKAFGVAIPLRQVFATPTVRALSQWIDSARSSKYVTITKAETKEYYPLSSAQKRLFIMHQLEDSSLAYNMPYAMKITGNLDIRQLERAFQDLIKRHESFRTSFHMVDGQPVQRIDQQVEFRITSLELGEQTLEAWQARFVRPFNLTQAPLLRVELVQMGPAEYSLIMDMHHIIADGVSMGVLTRELSALYEGQTLEPLQLQYKDYAEWQALSRTTEVIQAQKDYWLSAYQEEVPLLDLPIDYARPQHRNYEGELFPFELSEGVSQRLSQLAHREGVTLFMLLLAGYTALLHRYTGQEDIIVGTPVAGNSQPELQDVIGLFINTLALRNRPVGTFTFKEYLNKVKENTLQAYENQDYAFDELVEQLALARDMSRSALFDTMLVFQNYDSEELAIEGVQFSSLPPSNIRSKFDLTLTAMEAEGRIKCVFTYSTELFKPETIECMAGHLTELLDNISNDAALRLQDIQFITSEETKSIMQLSCGQLAQYRTDAALIELFEEQVRKSSGQRAVVSGENELSYEELNRRANQLARSLRARGAAPNSVIAVSMNPSVDLIISMLAVLKTGAIYLPIDPEQTGNRTNVILNDSQAILVLTDHPLSKELSFSGDVYQVNDGSIESFDYTDLSLPTSPEQQVYMIYTSGSTGTPKGVMVRNRNIVNYTQWFIREAGVSAADRTMLMSSSAFDLGYTGVFSSLLQGGELHVPSKEDYTNPARVLQMMASQRITFIKLTPSLFNLLFHDPAFAEWQPELRLVVLGGEKTNTTDVEKYLQEFPNSRIMNHYGPTETTIGVVFHNISSVNVRSFIDHPVIGRPIDNTVVYVLDKHNHLVPRGVFGEICVSGEAVSSGYFNQVEMTREKFVEDPFQPGQIMYKTGDLARWTHDGELELAGRKDNQVKVRGYRIELDEIKKQMLLREGVREAVIVPGANQEQATVLCAYFTANRSIPLDEIRAHLGVELPEYMIPTHFMQLDTLPLTGNGKLDVRALPEPDASMGGEVVYEAPRNEAESLLVSIWEEVLGFKPIGINHHFFASGGDSIKALQIISRLSRAGKKLTMKELFANPQIKLLGRYVREDSHVDRMKQRVTGPVDLTPIQKSYFLQHQRTGMNHFNQSLMLYREEGFNPETVRQIMEGLMMHHDVLRMSYHEEQGKVVQTHLDDEAGLFQMDVQDMIGLDEQELFIRVQQAAFNTQESIEIFEGPLVRAVIFRTDQGDHLLIVIHHMLIDGVSWKILLEDLAIGYQQLMEGQDLSFYPVTDSYPYYAAFLSDYAKGGRLAKERAYWIKTDQEEAGFLPRNEVHLSEYRYGDNRMSSVSLNREMTTQLLRETNQAYYTEINDILLAALALSIKECAGASKVKVTMEGHGRELMGDELDISRTVGWFTSKYPVCINLGDEEGLGTTIKEVKEQLRRVPAKGIGYGILKYMTTELPKLKEQTPLLLFNYLGQMDQDINSGLFRSSWLPAGNPVGDDVIRANPMEVIAYVAEGQLMINITYNHRLFDESIVENFATTYKKMLQQVIEHCAQQQQAEKTPSDYGDPHLTLQNLEVITLKFGTEGIEKIYPLANMQRGMLYHALENRGDRVYFEQLIMNIRGNLDVVLLQESLNLLMQRHEMLRASIEYDVTEEPRNIICQNREAAFVYRDLRGLQEQNRGTRVLSIAMEDKRKGFDLGKDTLVRFELLQTDEEQYSLIWSNHHILLDGWARGIILAELVHLYECKRTGKNIQLHEPVPYSEYVEWLQALNKDEAISYWKNYLGGYENKVQLPAGTSRSLNDGATPQEHQFRISRQLTKQMNDLANRNHVTFYTVMQCVWGIMLAKYNDTSDVVFGTVVSGREAQVSGIENMVGLFINTIPARIQWDEGHTFKQLVGDMQALSIEGSQHHHLGLAEIASLSSLKRDLIDHIMVFENYSVDSSLVEQGANDIGFVIEDVHSQEQTNYGFNLIAIPGEELVIKFAYDSGKYDESLMKVMENHMLTLLKQIVTDENLRVDDIQIMTKQEQIVLLDQYNDTGSAYPKGKTMHQLVSEQAAKTPEHVAVALGDNALTYKQLDIKSNQLARHLKAIGVGSNSMVGIMVERSPEMIVGILAIMKAGGAYVPIDPEYPAERIEFILEDSGSSIILEMGEGHTGSGRTSVAIDADYSHYSAEPLEQHAGPEDVAYMIYTSGSTGKPKGTMIPHSGLINYIFWAKDVYLQNQELDFALYSSFAFDLTITSIFTPLVTGNKIVVYPTSGDEPVILNVFRDQQAGVVKLTPSHLNLIKDMDNTRSSIKCLIVGGEDLKSELAREVYESFGGKVQIYNEYGPTETVVGCMIHPYNPETDTRISVPIGKPAANVQLYVLNKHQQLLPAGLPGELYIGGDGVSRGYFGRPELTMQKFVPNPFKEGTTLYRTGDLVQWMPNGDMEFLGRIDHQVKIRGYRIEPGEIEFRLLQQPEVKDVIVTSRQDDAQQSYLCAYIVPVNPSKTMDIVQLKQGLLYELPAYMIPAFFVVMDQLPLTVNGKVDLKALPEPEGSVTALQSYTPPETELERHMTDIWEDILPVKPISIHANLFEMGANSLNVMSFVSRLYSLLNFRIPFKDIFEKPTIADLANFVEKAKDLLEDYTEDCMQLTRTSEKNRIVFCFPPAASMGIAYMTLAQHLDSFGVYSFNFITSEDRIARYAQMMIDIQKEGSFTLMGYSSGGVLAFDVAKELNRRGYEVRDLIILDSKYRTEVEEHRLTEEQIRQEIQQKFNMSQYQDLEKLANDYLLELITKSYLYVHEAITFGTIDGNISYVTSGLLDANASIALWAQSTTGQFRQVKGYGKHMEMIDKNYPEIVKQNATLINELLLTNTK
ncbi:bacitracin synthase 3 [Paenibacillus xylanexedens]|uniref:non-ribosomal peptide synthetase n=1 Tax=Paenibacillus xylanexedens TaxID=528191 RepID=UPI00209CB49F|nr:non-ribosomal peptide synthase/polyketide synthase [Paenibacillus xylanexedens]MCP1426503.1 bacitracin synthase 3 [Paenibacillus xylanexedens]